MSNLLLTVIIASSLATIVWLVQNSLRPLTQKALSQTWHYYTGLIPVVFLLGGAEIVARAIKALRAGVLAANSSLLAGTMPAINAVTKTANAISKPAANLLQHENVARYATFIWAVGAVVFLTVNVSKYRAFRSFILKNSRASDMGHHYPVRVIVSAKATTPMLMGLWKPVVVLPDTQLSEKELAMIMSHELVHLRRGDLLVKLITLVANALHWFNPIAYVINKQMTTLCELSCDEQVVQKMDRENRRSYGETLLAMLAYGTMQKDVIGVSGLSGSKRSIKRRLSSLMNVKKTKKPAFVLSLVATIAVIALGGIAAYAASPSTPLNIPFSDGGGRNINVLYGDGTRESFDHNGNVTIQHPDGRLESFDKDGNPIPVISMQTKVSEPTREMTEDEIRERVRMHREKGLPVPQAYLRALGETD